MSFRLSTAWDWISLPLALGVVTIVALKPLFGLVCLAVAFALRLLVARERRERRMSSS